MGILGFSHDEVDNAPPLNEGEAILCPDCGDAHIVECGTDMKTGKKSNMLLFYQCGEESKLAGLAGKNIMARFMNDRTEDV